MHFSPKDTIWQVSALNFEIKTMLEQGVGTVWIEGEVSNFSNPASGHWYFTLKDEKSQIRAAMFRNRNQRAGFIPGNGQKILIRAQVTLYQARGEFQVIVDHLEEAGIGRLMREYEALKQKLAAEELFEARHKQTVPDAATHIGIITSPTGAAIRDALSVISRKSPGTRVTLFPTQVQGDAATPAIVNAIELANRHGECDVLLLIRGGGSLEDLWCFNEESVVRAVFHSSIPLVSGIGHEIDTTIVDLVADLRAPTPSVAAESVTRDQFELMARIDELSMRNLRSVQSTITQQKERVESIQSRLINLHPERKLSALRQNLAYVQRALLNGQMSNLRKHSFETRQLQARMQTRNPMQRILQATHQVSDRNLRLISGLRLRLQQQHRTLAELGGQIDSLSPLKTLARGYAAVQNDQNQLIKSVEDLNPGDSVKLNFSDGARQAKIEN